MGTLLELFVAEGGHGVYAYGFSGGGRARYCCYETQQDCDRQQNHRIVGAAFGPPCQEFVEGQRQEYADHNSCADAHDCGGESDLQDVATASTERDANAELVGALGYGIRDNAVKVDRGQGEREHGEGAEELGY